MKHPVEAKVSWSLHLERVGETQESNVGIVDEESSNKNHVRRDLRHHHKNDDYNKKKKLELLEHQKEEEFRQKQAIKEEKATKARKHADKHRNKKMLELMANPGISSETVHGMMIDAGSTGSRMHVYEFDPRVLNDAKDVQEAVSGRKLSFPGTQSRWTDRLRPGLAEFASLPDDQLLQGIAEYLEPLLDFAKKVLHTKRDEFDTYPIFLKATAGMRILDPQDRSRVINAVRTLFANSTYCPFWMEEEHVRVISGEEEAIYGWAGVNFGMGNLVQDSEGAGTVINPRLTYGALDLGGGSTQISFYEPDGDIMSNLFKLQIGQGKHWNVYAHSFLHYGIVEATRRLEARIAASKSPQERLVDGVYNPCLPGGAKKDIRSNIHLDRNNVETYKYNASSTSSKDGYYEAILVNDNKKGDFDKCMDLTQNLLHKEENEWCEYSHKGDCSFAGIYQPELPKQSEHFGEFLAFSNFYHVWSFLGLPSRSSLRDLREAAQKVCSMSEKQLIEYNEDENKQIEEGDELNGYCFNSVYVYQLLRNGYGFQEDDYITATNVVNGQKVGWALGSMLYEINTLPWFYKNFHGKQDITTSQQGGEAKVVMSSVFLLTILVMMAVALISIFKCNRGRKNRGEYIPIKEKHTVRFDGV